MTITVCTFHTYITVFINVVTSLLRRTGADISVLNYTECPWRNVPDFGRMFLKLKYTDITQNTYIQS